MAKNQQKQSGFQNGLTIANQDATQSAVQNGTQTALQNGSQSSTTTQQRDPWAPATPYLTGLLGQAAGQYAASSNPLTSAALTAGQNAAIGNAASGATTGLAQQGMGAVSDLLDRGGLNDVQRAALSGIGGSVGNFNGQLGTTMSMLSPIADGSQVGTNNAAFQQALGASLDKARDTIGSQFAGAGRYGSAAMGNAEATTLGNIAASATQQQYNQDRANQLAAIGQMGSLASSGLSGNLSAAGQRASIGQSGIGAILSGIGQIGSLGADQNIDAQSLMGVGQQGWDNLNKYASLVSSLGQQGGTSTGSQVGNTSQASTGSTATNSTGSSSGTSVGNTAGTSNQTTSSGTSLLGTLLSGAGMIGNLFMPGIGGVSAATGMANFFK